ncbi:MAG: hypothetical protein ABI901_13840 [Roseiflexaceae bacterium]
MKFQRLSRRYCSYAGQHVAYAVVSQGPMIVLLHGLGGTADFWQLLLQCLRGRILWLVSIAPCLRAIYLAM